MRGIVSRIRTRLSEIPVSFDHSGFPAEPCCLFNGKNSGNSEAEGIVLEMYPPLVFVILYRFFSDEIVETLNRELAELFSDKPIIIQDRSVRPFRWRLESGNIPEEMIIQENGLQFIVHPKRGQNAGFFPDMREGRSLIRRIVREGRESGIERFNVLNLFSYTCSLSVAAVAAGAGNVVNIDKNKRSLEIGRRNHYLNFSDLKERRDIGLSFLPHDIFKSFGKLKKSGPYNLIIADPPPSQKGSFELETDYPRLIKRLPSMLAEKGVLLLSLNSNSMGWEDFEEILRTAIVPFVSIERIQPPSDYSPFHDGHGLKLLKVTF